MASGSSEYLEDGWVARGMRAGLAARGQFTPEGVLIGSDKLGPLAGARAVSLNNPEAFVKQSHFARGIKGAPTQGNQALQHLLQVENDINQAAQGLRGDTYPFTTPFPSGAFGNGVKAAVQVVASQRDKGGAPVITLTLGSFDTHQNQLGIHSNLMQQLAEGVAALQGALTELGAWDRTLVMTFSEFGLRAHRTIQTAPIMERWRPTSWDGGPCVAGCMDRLRI